MLVIQFLLRLARIMVLIAMVGIFLSLFTVASAAEILDVESCVRIALQENHGLKADQLEILAKHEDVRGLRGLAKPQVDFKLAYQWQNKPTGLIPSHVAGVPAVYDDQMGYYTLNMKQVIYDAGKTHSLIRSGEIAVEGQKQESKAHSLRVVGSVIKSFYKVIQLQNTIEAQHQSVNALQKLYDDMQMKLDLGRIAEVDLLQVGAQLASEQEKTARYKGELDQQTAILLSMMGYGMEHKVQLSGNLKDYELQLKPEQKSLSRNPALQKTVHRISQTDELLKAAKADSNPKVILNGQYDVKRLGKAGNPQDEMWLVGLQVSLPVFDGGIISSNINKAQLQVAEAKEFYAEQHSELEASAWSAQSSLETANARVEAAVKATISAAEAYRIVELSYQVGKRSMTDVLVAQAAMTNAQIIYYQAMDERINATVSLALAYGEMPYTIRER
ncbi:MAG: outer rane channel protein TolC [Firmicutes bacterium]|nr:outer rane channel protein TolC [Bacillota bacterium]